MRVIIMQSRGARCRSNTPQVKCYSLLWWNPERVRLGCLDSLDGSDSWMDGLDAWTARMLGQAHVTTL
jgi:hypothetical protein